MNNIKKLIKKIDEKLSTKQGEKLKVWVEEHKKELRKIEKKTLSSLLSSIGLGDDIDIDKLSIELVNIQLTKDPELLIKGMKDSADVFKKIHARAEKEAEEYNSMIKSLSISGAKTLLPFIISLF